MKVAVRAAFITLPMIAIAAMAATPGRADDDFFRGKTITIINSTGSGGSYYHVAQMFSRHLPRHIPGNPAVIVKSMPGGGNVLATNFMYTNAPRDGTHIATINNSIPLHQTLDGRGVRYDANKFNWLGSTGNYNSVAYVWHTAGVNSFKELQQREITLGGTGAGSSIVIYPTVANNVLGAKFKIVLGYNSTTEIDLAMERGEVQSRTGSYTDLMGDHASWVKDGKVKIIFQTGAARHPDLADVPLMTDLAANDEQRDILKLVSSPIALGRPYLAPPGVPADRLAILREAFQATMRDPLFLEEAARMGHEIDPRSAEEITRVVSETIGAPAGIIAKAKIAIGDTTESK
jgi:tripartite-type tricarboxylate transporter receptor subunit TctC